MRKSFLAVFALMALLIGGFAVSHPGGADAANPLRVATACTPLTTSQLAQPGDAQTCRVRVTNQSGASQDVTVTHDSKFTLVSATVCFGASCSGTVAYTGQTLTITNNSQAVIKYQYVRGGPYEDGIGLTQGCATAPGLAKYCGIEQKSLP